MKELEIPKIMAKATLALVKKACGPDTIDSIGALLEFSERISAAVDKELIDNKKQVISDVSKIIDGLGR